MSYQDFWDGPADLARYYRDKNRCEMDRRNTELWLQGAYIYEAILDCVPALNFFGKNRNPQPYREEPIPLTGEQKREREEKAQEKKKSETRKMLEAWAATVNANRKKRMGKEQTNGS